MRIIPFDYFSLIQDRVLIITGVGRSGTTILGKLIGSFENTWYFFEPAFMKYVTDPDMMRAIFVEDYLLPLIQGRNINLNPNDDSYYGHYRDINEIKLLNWKLENRTKAIGYLKETKPLIVIKTNEIADFLRYKDAFPGTRLFHIVRNGNDVIHSALTKGWYSDKYMMNSFVDYVDGIAPWYIDKSLIAAKWFYWSPITRTACVWRTLVTLWPANITYERLVSHPGTVLEKLAFSYGKPTDRTWKHINTILAHKPKQNESLTDQIEEPEREKYIQTLKRYGYEP